MSEHFVKIFMSAVLPIFVDFGQEMCRAFLSLPPPWLIFYLLDYQVTFLSYEGVHSYNASLTFITIVYTAVEGVGDEFNVDFGVKNFAGTGILTCKLPTCFFFVAAAPSILAKAFSWSCTGPFK